MTVDLSTALALFGSFHDRVCGGDCRSVSSVIGFWSFRVSVQLGFRGCGGSPGVLVVGGCFRRLGFCICCWARV